MNATTLPAHIVNPEASVHELMNGATEWLQYAQRLTGFLAESLDDVDELPSKEMANVLTVVDALTRHGLDCVLQAHTRMVREQLHATTTALGTG